MSARAGYYLRGGYRPCESCLIHIGKSGKLSKEIGENWNFHVVSIGTASALVILYRNTKCKIAYRYLGPFKITFIPCFILYSFILASPGIWKRKYEKFKGDE